MSAEIKQFALFVIEHQAYRICPDIVQENKFSLIHFNTESKKFLIEEIYHGVLPNQFPIHILCKYRRQHSK